MRNEPNSTRSRQKKKEKIFFATGSDGSTVSARLRRSRKSWAASDEVNTGLGDRAATHRLT